MKEYDLYIPLFYNDGSQIEEEKFVRLREQLLGAFGGLTFFSQTAKRLLAVRRRYLPG